MSERNQQEKSTLGSLLLGIMLGVLIIVALIVGYFVYNTSVNTASEYGASWFHRFTYCQAVKKCGENYLNVKWPFMTDSSWEFQPLEYNDKDYIIGTCKVTAEGNPEKIDVACVFQVNGREVGSAFFAAGGKTYYDGIGFTRQLLNELLNYPSKNTSSRNQITSTIAAQ